MVSILCKIIHFPAYNQLLLHSHNKLFVNSITGQILWRQVLERDEQMQHLHVGKDLISISSSPMVFVRAWDKSNGYLLWEWTLFQQKSEGAKWLVEKNRLYHMVPLNQQLEISIFSLESGTDLGSKKVAAAWMVPNQFSCAVAGPNYVCATKDSFYWISPLDASAAFQEVPLAKFEIKTGALPQVVEVGENSFALKLPGGVQTVFLMGDKGPKAVHETALSTSLLATAPGSNIMFKLENKAEVIYFDHI
jgi:hypothetical protein